MKFAFIAGEAFPVAAACRVLEVTRQGYYAYLKRRAAQAQDEVELQSHVRRAYEDGRGAYGSPRVLKELQRKGIKASKRRVERTMRALGLQGRKRRRSRTTTKANWRHPVAPNLLDRDFTAERPNQRWVTDISYVWTDEGWCYLAVILDLFSRAVVGWALDATLTTELPLRALEMAVLRRSPRSALQHHSDRGCQYTSQEYRRALAELGIEVSMSRKGNCWDNAVAESFFSTLKTELIHDRRWASRTDLRSAVFDYIEIFYNRQRLHSTLGYMSPAQFETQHAAAAA